MQYLSDFLLILIIYCCVQSYVASNVLLLCISYPHWNRLTYSWVQNCAPHSFVHHLFFTSLTLIVNQFKSVKSCECIFQSLKKKKKSPVIYIPYIHWISTRGQCVQCVRFDVTGFVRAKKHTKRNDKEWVCVQIRAGENLIIAWMWSFYLFFLHPHAPPTLS